MDMIGKIRRMKLRDGLTISVLAWRTGLSRNTVKKWLKADAHRPREHRRSGKTLLVQLQAQGYRGGYTTLTNFIRDCRAEASKDGTRAFLPLSFEYGEVFQFDWSEEGIVVGGVYYQAQVAHLKPCASRAFWLVGSRSADPSQGHEMLFDAHTRAFAVLGGVARRGIYDNMKTAVDKVTKGKGRVVNARFMALFSHYLFDPDFGTPALPRC